MSEPVCNMCGDNSGWIADPAYGWVMCANCNDEGFKPKPNAFPSNECLPKSQERAIAINDDKKPKRALMNDGKGCSLCGALVHDLSEPYFGQRMVLCPACPPNQIVMVHVNSWVELADDSEPIDRCSSRLEFPEFTSEEDFFDAVTREGLQA